MRMLLKIVIYALAVWVAVQLVDGLDYVGETLGLLAIALIFAIVNAVVRPIVKLFSFPVIMLTLGLFIFVINAAMFALTIWITGGFDLGLTSTGFGATFLGALVVTLVTWAGEAIIPDR